jgi:hypothetical protein
MRGYQPFWQVGSGPLNISNALKASCETYDLYVLARQSFSSNWGGPVPGLLSWETQQRRSKAEVLELFDRVLERLESGEAHPTGHSRRRGNSGSRTT